MTITRRKIVCLILVGVLTFLAGVISAGYFFKDRHERIESGKLKASSELDMTDVRTILGPVFIASGLLLTICGVTWIPIYKQKVESERIRRQSIEMEVK